MAPPGPVKISHKKNAAKGGRIDFMFLGPPPPYPAAGPATATGMHSCYFIFFFDKMALISHSWR